MSLVSSCCFYIGWLFFHGTTKKWFLDYISLILKVYFKVICNFEIFLIENWHLRLWIGYRGATWCWLSLNSPTKSSLRSVWIKILRKERGGFDYNFCQSFTRGVFAELKSVFYILNRSMLNHINAWGHTHTHTYCYMLTNKCVFVLFVCVCLSIYIFIFVCAHTYWVC